VRPLSINKLIYKIDSMISQVDKLFGSRTRVLILSKLVMNPNHSFYIRQLSTQLGVTFSVVYKELENLKALGLVTEQRKGRLRLFTINKHAVIYDELRKLLLKTTALGQQLMSSLPELKTAKYALIYGSIARGEELETSDVDLLIIGDIAEENLIDGIRKVEEGIGREINYILWSEREFEERAKTKHHLLTEIADNPIIGLVGDVNELRRAVKG
jgi:predicted nucleotidyltransferase